MQQPTLIVQAAAGVPLVTMSSSSDQGTSGNDHQMICNCRLQPSNKYDHYFSFLFFSPNNKSSPDADFFFIVNVKLQKKKKIWWSEVANIWTLPIRDPNFSGQTRSISLLLIPWLLIRSSGLISVPVLFRLMINTLRPRRNGWHFATTFSSALPWMKMSEFRLKFHWSLFLKV